MKTRNIGYWVTTGLVAFVFLAGGVSDVTHAPNVMGGMTHLGYPAYFVTLLGVWKLLGALALLAPGFPRLKEWAYAGMFFDLTGAAVSHGAVGDPVGNILTPLLIVALLIASWALRPESRVVAAQGIRSFFGHVPGTGEAKLPLAA
jgi:uncharacterized membrane protein YphA (DoxX/SURF4 family)